MLQDAAAEKSDDQVSQHHAVARDVPRGVLGPIDVAAHDPVQVAPPDDDPERDAALVHAFGVVRRPRDRVRDARVDAQRTQEGAGVPDPRAFGAEEHGKPDDAEQGDANVTETTFPGPVGDVADADGQTRGRRVRRDREQLRPRVRVPEIADDGGEEEGEGVQGPVGAHVDDGGQPGLPVLDRGPEVRHLELLVLRARLLIPFQAADDAGPVDIGQEARLIREVVDHPEGSEADDDGQEAFEDEDPGPPSLAADTPHLPDRARQKPTEGARHGRGGEEDGHADTEFGTLVPTRQVITDAGEQTGLGETEEPPRRHQPAVIVAQAHGDHDDPPQDHDDRDEDGGAKAFEEDVGERFEDGV